MEEQRGFLRRILVNGFSLLSGSAASSGLGMLSLALTARLVHPREFGTIVLIATYAELVTRLLASQSWLALIRFGAEARQDPAKLSLVLSTGLLLDGVTAIAGATIFLLSIPAFAFFFHLGAATTLLAAGFALALATNIAGMPIAVLRMYDRFHLLGWQNAAGPALKLVLLACAYLSSTTGIIVVGCIWIASQCLGQVVLVYFGFRELRRQRIALSPLREIVPFLRHDGRIGRFFVFSNLDATVRVFRDIDTLIIGAFLSPAAAGFYRIARQLGMLVSKPADSMLSALYPELVALVQARRHHLLIRVMARCALYAAALGGLACAGFALLGSDALRIFLGAGYTPAYTIGLLVLLAQLVWAVAHPLSPAMIALDRQRSMLIVNAAATASYLVLLGLFGRALGLSGIGISLICFYAIWAGLSFLVVSRALRRQVGTVFSAAD